MLVLDYIMVECLSVSNHPFKSFPKTSCSLYACVYKGTANPDAHAHYVLVCSSEPVRACALSENFGPNVVLRRSLNKEPDHLNLKVKGKCVAVVYCKRHNCLALILCCLYFFCFYFYISIR